MIPGTADELTVALQRGLPLERDPFGALADEVGCTADDLLAQIAALRARGLVRRFGAVFDVRRLGYKSALCAAVVPAAHVETMAERLTPLAGVTHCYLRETVPVPDPTCPNLWFTLSEPADVFAAMADEVRARLVPYPVHFLPATKRYKVDVVFGGATRAREESVEPGPPVSMRERAIIRALQGDTAVRRDYFAALAETIGIKEWDLLSTLELWRRSGRLKRIGLLLAHRKAGYLGNGMCCWRVEEGAEMDAAGRALAARNEVTHCYARPVCALFDYNLFAMVHGRTPADAAEIFAALESACGLSNGTQLLSTREFKKTSMTFFADGFPAQSAMAVRRDTTT